MANQYLRYLKIMDTRNTVHLKKDLHHFEFVDSETKTTFRFPNLINL
jgi:hypothetical protein